MVTASGCSFSFAGILVAAEGLGSEELTGAVEALEVAVVGGRGGWLLLGRHLCGFW